MPAQIDNQKDGGRPRDWTVGDVIAAYEDGTIVLDDGLTTWNDIRAKEFLGKQAVSNSAPQGDFRAGVAACVGELNEAMRSAANSTELERRLERLLRKREESLNRLSTSKRGGEMSGKHKGSIEHRFGGAAKILFGQTRKALIAISIQCYERRHLDCQGKCEPFEPNSPCECKCHRVSIGVGEKNAVD